MNEGYSWTKTQVQFNWICVPNWIFAGPPMPPHVRLVVLSLFAWADQNRRPSKDMQPAQWPSKQEVAAHLQMDPEDISEAMDWMEAQGMFVVDGRGDPTVDVPNDWWESLPDSPSCDNRPAPLVESPIADPTKRKKFNARKIIKAYERTMGICWYCGQKMEPSKFVVDHVIPKSRGGADEDGNLVPSCFRCNGAKNNLSVEEFRLSAQRRQIILVDGKFWFERSGAPPIQRHGAEKADGA